MRKRTGTVMAAIFGAVVLFGTVGAVSRFVSRKERPKAYECKVVLRDILWAQRAYREAHGSYARSFEELQFKLPEKKVYAYELREIDGFTAACSANLDEDAALDAWTLSPASGEAVHVSSDDVN